MRGHAADPAQPRRHARATSSTWPSGWCRRAASTASATPTSPPSSKITTASLHYHFAGKAELGRGAHRALRGALLAALDADRRERSRRPGASCRPTPSSTPTCSRRAHVPVRHARRRVPDAARADADGVLRFFDANEAWLAGRARATGARQGTLRFAGDARDAARMIVGGLEGAMLVSRLHADPARFSEAADRLLASLRPAGAEPGQVDSLRERADRPRDLSSRLPGHVRMVVQVDGGSRRGRPSVKLARQPRSSLLARANSAPRSTASSTGSTAPSGSSPARPSGSKGAGASGRRRGTKRWPWSRRVRR